MHVKFGNLTTTTNGTLFFNTFRGSKIEEGVAVSFKLNNNSNLPMKDIKSKGRGTFTVSECIKWFRRVQAYKTKLERIRNFASVSYMMGSLTY